MTIKKDNESTVHCIDEEYQYYCNQQKRRKRNALISIFVVVVIGGFTIGYQIAEVIRNV